MLSTLLCTVLYARLYTTTKVYFTILCSTKQCYTLSVSCVSFRYKLTKYIIDILYYIRYYSSLKQDSLHHVILPKIHYQINRHTVGCHSKNTAFYHHVSLHSVLCPWVAWNTTHYYMFCTVCVPYILSCALKNMGFYHTSRYDSAFVTWPYLTVSYLYVF